MKQPKVMVFGKTYNVIEIRFDNETGKLDAIFFEYPNGDVRLIKECKKVDYGRGPVKLIEPMAHPHEEIILFPNINDVFIEDKKEQIK